MNEQFIPYKQALELKRLGFDEPCIGWYNDDESFVSEFAQKQIASDSLPNAPLWQQAFDWIRENHGLNSWITSKTNSEDVTIYIPNGRTIPDTIKIGLIVDIIPYAGFKSYKEAQLACLDKLIEIIKTKK